MEFGLARFLEMFEERFGRRTTTVLLGTFGLAVFGYCIKAFIEAVVYVYHEAKEAPLAAGKEDLVSHLMFFGAQFIVTLLLSVLVWRWFTSNRLRTLENRWKAFEKRMTGYRAEMKKAEESMADLNSKTVKVAALQSSFDNLRVAVDALRVSQAAKEPAANPAPPEPSPGD